MWLPPSQTLLEQNVYRRIVVSIGSPWVTVRDVVLPGPHNSCIAYTENGLSQDNFPSSSVLADQDALIALGNKVLAEKDYSGSYLARAIAYNINLKAIDDQ